MAQLSFIADGPPQTDPQPTNTAPWKSYGDVTLYHGDCVDVLNAMPANSVDASCTDPPYGLGFMGKEWDTFSPESVATNTRKAFQQRHGVNVEDRATSTNPNIRGRLRSPAMSPSQIEYDRTVQGQRAFQRWTEEWAAALIRVLRPGAHVLVCGAPRSAHRMVCGLEDAGFEIRDSFAWLFAQGFPKSHNVDDERGTALKPGHEPIALARKPLDGTVEENLRRWGVGVLNIDACRLDVDDADYARNCSGDRGHDANRTRQLAFGMTAGSASEIGRWPANVVLDEAAAAMLDAQAGNRRSGPDPKKRGSKKFRQIFGAFQGQDTCDPARGYERGGASRFYFVAKPSRGERDFGCDDLPMRSAGECTDRVDGSAGLTPYAGAGRSGGGRNFHPTVKPIALMRWLLQLITPPGGTVVDPFVGSGTTGMACAVDGYTFIGIDKELDYLTLSDVRITAVLQEIA